MNEALEVLIWVVIGLLVLGAIAYAVFGVLFVKFWKKTTNEVFNDDFWKDRP